MCLRPVSFLSRVRTTLVQGIVNSCVSSLYRIKSTVIILQGFYNTISVQYGLYNIRDSLNTAIQLHSIMRNFIEGGRGAQTP